MKIALYIERGREQIVLTPESDTERQILNKLHEAPRELLAVHKGEFYACQGGYTRMRETSEPKDTIIVLEPLVSLGQAA
jgi:hypothetical protein